MKLTVIRDDNTVGVDGEFRQVNLASLPLQELSIRAVQWNGTKGHIEYDDSPNEDITDISDFQNCVDLWTAAAPQIPEPVVLTPADHIAAAHARINSAYEMAVNNLTAGYPPNEISSWPKQEAEARAYLADPTTIAPWLINAAAARGIDAGDLATLIVGNADALAPLHGALTGKRQKLRDQIDALGPDPALDVMDQIVW